MNFDNMLDPKASVDIKTISSTKSWKQRIVELMTSSDKSLFTYKEILEHTDPNFTGDNYTSRKHCLDSQMTYIRQDYKIVTKKIDDKVCLLGVIKGDKLIPFKNAKQHV